MTELEISYASKRIRDEELTLGPTPRRSKECFSPIEECITDTSAADARDFLTSEYYAQFPNRWSKIR